MHANDIPKTLCPILWRSFTASPGFSFWLECGDPAPLQFIPISCALDTSSHHKARCMQPLYPSCHVRERVHFDPSSTSNYRGSLGAILTSGSSGATAKRKRVSHFRVRICGPPIYRLLHSLEYECSEAGPKGTLIAVKPAERKLIFWRTVTYCPTGAGKFHCGDIRTHAPVETSNSSVARPNSSACSRGIIGRSFGSLHWVEIKKRPRASSSWTSDVEGMM
ncbi:hypothetical protein B0H10DRAFT_1955476 [Mycena sp. CBHHK59/15]|nr:hypothetical protein B0H10DRAFT_1955476 [Mycena sp. CBHHK59/15]